MRTSFEYDFETITLTEEQKSAVELGVANLETLNPIIRDIINKRAKSGWEPLYPFSFPSLWFRKIKNARSK